MARFCRQHPKAKANERVFCQALLNQAYPFWNDVDVDTTCKRGFRLPPDDFVYGVKHPKQGNVTGVAAALQHYEIPIDIYESIPIPDFIAINKTATRLGLTTVQDLHQYRRTMNNHPRKADLCSSPSTVIKSIPDMIHGRVTGAQPSMRDLIENRFLEEWLHKVAIRRCKNILNQTPAGEFEYFFISSQ